MPTETDTGLTVVEPLDVTPTVRHWLIPLLESRWGRARSRSNGRVRLRVSTDVPRVSLILTAVVGPAALARQRLCIYALGARDGTGMDIVDVAVRVLSDEAETVLRFLGLRAVEADPSVVVFGP